MQKFFTQKAFLLLTSFFVLLAICSFAAFRETEAVCQEAQCCLRSIPPVKSGHMFWEVISRQFFSILSF